MDPISHAVEKFPDNYVQVCGGELFATNWYPVKPTNLTSSVESELKKTPDGSCFPVMKIHGNEIGFFFSLSNGFDYPVFLPSPKAETLDENQELKEEIAALKEQLALTEAKRLPTFREFSDASAQTSPSDVALAAVQDALDEAKAAVAIQVAPAPTAAVQDDAAPAAAVQVAVDEVVAIQVAPAPAATVQAAVDEVVAIQDDAVPAAAAPVAAEQAALDEVVAIQVAPASAGAVESADKSFCLQKAMKELGKLGEEINLLKKNCWSLKRAYEEASQSVKEITKNKFSALDTKAVRELREAQARASLAWINAKDELLRVEESVKSLKEQVDFWTNMVELKMPAEQMKLLFNLMFGQKPEALESFRKLQRMILEEAIQVFIPLSVLAFGNRMEHLDLDVSTPSKPNSDVVLEISVNADGIILSANGHSKRQEIADALAKASNLKGSRCYRGPWCSHFITYAMSGLLNPCNWLHTEEDYLTMEKAYSAAAKKQRKGIGTSVCKTVWDKNPCPFGSKCFYIHIEIPVE